MLWRALDENDAFQQYTVHCSSVYRLVVPLLFLMCEGRKDTSKVGIIHICTFILLLLSGSRTFSVSLNAPFRLALPLDIPRFSDGNHIDFLIIVLHKLVVNGNDKLNSVYNCFFTIIGNISPYCKHLNTYSSIRLVRLFKLFSSPRYIYESQANHLVLFFLLDIFSNLIQYQYEGTYLLRISKIHYT